MDETQQAAAKRQMDTTQDLTSPIQEDRQEERIQARLNALLDMRVPGEISLTHDGKYAAFVVWEVVPGEQKPRGRIWVADTAAGKAQPATSGKRGEHYPQWSPDGKQLAFITRPDGDKEKPQLHLIALTDLLAHSGGKGRLVCKLPNGVSQLAWSPNGRQIAFLSREGNEPKRDPKILTAARHRRLWTVYPDQNIPTAVTPADIHIWEYCWSPDSQQFALYYSHSAEDNDWYHSEIGVIAAEGGSVRQLTNLKWPARRLAWSPDATQIAYLSGPWSDPGRGSSDILTISVINGETRNLTPGIACSPSWCSWLPDACHLLYCAVKGVTHQIGLLNTQNGKMEVLEEDFVMQRDQPCLSITPDFRYCATLHSSSQQPGDVWFGTINNKRIEWKRISRLNPLIDEGMELARTERISYESVDGWRIYGLFTSPLASADGNRNGKPPLYVNIHGGPAGTSCDGWNTTIQIFAAAGFAVFQPNMRGSWGQGMTFANAVLGDMGGKDLQDILNGIDYLVREGLVDDRRICIGGWSNGGFLSAWAITQSQRFRAAMVGAGITDWHNMHAQSNIPDADMLLLASNPLEQPEVYSRCSPMTYARYVTTPTLILHGENDPCVPVAQAYAFYRALCERQIPVECVIYPREGHGLNERDHVRDALMRQIGWFERSIR